MRRLALLALLGCDAQNAVEPDVEPAPLVGFDGTFRGIGEADMEPNLAPDTLDSALPDAAVVRDANLTDSVAPDVLEPDAAPPPPEPLALTFEAITQDSGALRITDLDFIPGTNDFLLLDKDGYVFHMRMNDAGASLLGSFQIDETWIDSDAGLISLAFDPDFAANRFFYLGFSTSREANVVKRYTWDADDLPATKASARVIIEVVGERAPRSWHNVGSIGFTDEGYLWALSGDKVLDELAQDVSSPLGGLLRVIPNREPEGEGYSVPDDNPWADGSGHPALYAKGMRSPWKGTLHDGVWYWGDIGLNTVEEVNRISAPAQNFGWPTAEGPCVAEEEGDCEGFADPWHHFGRGVSRFVAEDPDATASRKRSVWVGPVHTGENDRYDGRWNDVIVFGDMYSGFIRAAHVDGGDSWHAGHLAWVTGMRQAPDGYIYAFGLGTWPVDAPEAPAPIYRVLLAD